MHAGDRTARDAEAQAEGEVSRVGKQPKKQDNLAGKMTGLEILKSLAAFLPRLKTGIQLAGFVVLAVAVALIAGIPHLAPHHIHLLTVLAAFGLLTLVYGLILTEAVLSRIPKNRVAKFVLTSLFLLLAFFLAVVVLTSVFSIGEKAAPTPEHSQDTRPTDADSKRRDEIEIADLGFEEYGKDTVAPRLDLKLTNRGTRSAYVTRAKLTVKKVWILFDIPQTYSALVPPDHNYALTLSRRRDPPYSIELSISEGLKPDEFGRFTIELKEEPWPESNTVYLADVELLINSDGKAFPKSDVAFLITQQGSLVTDSEGLEAIVEGQQKLKRPVDREKVKDGILGNKAIVLDVEKKAKVMSHSLKKLVEAAQTTDLK